MKWVEKSLDELGTVGRGRSRHRPRDAAHLYGGPFPFVQTGDVKHAGLYLRNFEQTYSEAGLGQSKLWPSGTLCITIAANIADTAILGIDACFPDSVIGFIADKTKADTRFIKYLFDALLKKKYQTFSQGVAQDNLSQEKLLSLKLTLPEDAGDGAFRKTTVSRMVRPAPVPRSCTRQNHWRHSRRLAKNDAQRSSGHKQGELHRAKFAL